MKKLVVFSAILAFVAAAAALVSCDSGSGSIDESVLNQVTFVDANPANGFNYGYYYYVPQSIKDASKKYLFMQSTNSGNIFDDYASFGIDDIEIHTESARRSINGLTGYGHELGCVLLVPVIPRPSSPPPYMEPQILNRAALLNNTGKAVRVDLQLIEMIDDLKAHLKSAGINLEPKILINGFSGSGAFGNRFTALHPELVQAVVSGGMSGMPIVPKDLMEGERLIYPVGIADLEEITGTPFNLQQYIKVPQFLFLGSADTSNPLDAPLYFSDEDRRIVAKVFGREKQERWAKSIPVYEEQGCSITYRIYPGIGHDITNEMSMDIIAFFKSNM